jgi:hypothetical protein
MWRTVLTAILAYGFGHPYFDGSRPATFDRPLQAFHIQVDNAARVGWQKFLVIEDRVMRFAIGAAARVEEQVNRSSDPDSSSGS